MLFIVTKPPQFTVGVFSCEAISANDAAALISSTNASGDVKAYLFHGATKRALKLMTGIDFEMVQKTNVPIPTDGDQFLHIKVKPGSSGRPNVEDLEFLKIDFAAAKSI